MLQELNDVMKMELIADKQCGEIQQVRCYWVLHALMYRTVVYLDIVVTTVIYIVS
jgi:hypothetical protein